MDLRDKLYDAFGEMIYLMAMADGSVQKEEIQKLRSIIAYHPWAKEINWSFDYENKRSGDLEDTYQKVLHACIDIGPNEEYEKLFEVMEAVAESSFGVTKDERELITRFRKDLIKAFSK